MGWYWNNLTEAAGAPLRYDVGDGGGCLTSYAFNFSDSEPTQHVAYIGADLHIHELYWNLSGWHHNDLTGRSGSPLAMIVQNEPAGNLTGYVLAADETEHIIYQDGNFHLVELYYDGSRRWQYNDLTERTGAPRGWNPTGYAFDAQATQHVVYPGYDDNHLHELWWDGNGWHHSYLSTSYVLPRLGYGSGPPACYVFPAQNTQHVVYGTDDGRIIELEWGQVYDVYAWSPKDLTTATGAPSAMGGPLFGYMFDFQATQHVVYRGDDSHIHELYCDNSGWHHHDLTHAARAPLTIGAEGTYDEGTANGGDPIGYVFAAQVTQHVLYVGQEGHIHELYWNYSHGWRHNDLTIATGAPVPAVKQRLTGYTFAADSTQHVFYIGRDSNIYELYWKGEGE